MKVYEFTFPGYYIGGYGIVIAENEEEARKLAREELDTDVLTNKLGDKETDFTLELLFDSEEDGNCKAIVRSNGDY
jgi:carbamoylphosphate synthase large subunit